MKKGVPPGEIQKFWEKFFTPNCAPLFGGAPPVPPYGGVYAPTPTGCAPRYTGVLAHSGPFYAHIARVWIVISYARIRHEKRAQSCDCAPYSCLPLKGDVEPLVGLVLWLVVCGIKSHAESIILLRSDVADSDLVGFAPKGEGTHIPHPYLTILHQ